jgi:hypothetical protein
VNTERVCGTQLEVCLCAMCQRVVNFTSNDRNKIEAFLAAGNKIFRFPLELDKNFVNLRAITLKNTKIKEIFHGDLMPFGDKLIFFGIYFSEIQTIRKDLFRFNANLKVILLHNN